MYVTHGTGISRLDVDSGSESVYSADAAFGHLLVNGDTIYALNLTDFDLVVFSDAAGLNSPDSTLNLNDSISEYKAFSFVISGSYLYFEADNSIYQVDISSTPQYSSNVSLDSDNDDFELGSMSAISISGIQTILYTESKHELNNGSDLTIFQGWTRYGLFDTSLEIDNILGENNVSGNIVNKQYFADYVDKYYDSQFPTDAQNNRYRSGDGVKNAVAVNGSDLYLPGSPNVVTENYVIDSGAFSSYEVNSVDSDNSVDYHECLLLLVRTDTKDVSCKEEITETRSDYFVFIDALDKPKYALPEGDDVHYVERVPSSILVDLTSDVIVSVMNNHQGLLDNFGTSTDQLDYGNEVLWDIGQDGVTDTLDSILNVNGTYTSGVFGVNNSIRINGISAGDQVLFFAGDDGNLYFAY